MTSRNWSAGTKRRLSCMVLGLYDYMAVGEFMTTVRDVAVGVVLLSPARRLVYANKYATEHSGQRTRELLGREFGSVESHRGLVSPDGLPLTDDRCPVCLAFTGPGTFHDVVGIVCPGAASWTYVAAKATYGGGVIFTMRVVDREHLPDAVEEAAEDARDEALGRARRA